VVRHGPGPALQPWTLIAAGAATVLEAKLSSWESFLALIGFCVLGSASYIAMEIYAGFKPDQSQAFLARFRTWMEAHTDRVIIMRRRAARGFGGGVTAVSAQGPEPGRAA
jgi:Sap, sulfolipid-1-addressing protein